jgi:hypothetical protein
MSAFNLQLAIQLAEASEIAYGELLGFDRPGWAVGAKETPIDNTQTDIHATLIELPAVNALAFKGTHGFRNWMEDGMVERVDLGTHKVHRGFWEAHKSIRIKAWNVLKTADPRANKPLWITGHSLGGALAKLMAIWIAQNFPLVTIEHVYTYGEPRWTNFEGAVLYDKLLGGRTWRVVDKLDPVPMIPFLLGRYRHTEQNEWFDGEGWMENMRPEIKKLPHQIKCLWNEWRRGDFESIEDHMIAHYLTGLKAGAK